MVMNMIIFLTVLVYGGEFLVFMYLKINHIKDYVEKNRHLFWNKYDIAAYKWHLSILWKIGGRWYFTFRIISRIFV